MKIGLRTIKTTFAIFISMMIYFILKQINEDLSLWFSPFFSSIAAAFSIQPGRNVSIQMGKRRAIGSLIGGFLGMFLVFILLQILCSGGSINDLKSGPPLNLFIYLTICSLGILILIPLALKLKQKDAVFVCILTYCSITIGVYTLPELQYGLNRILSTLIGIGIAIIISAYRFPRKRQTNIMFTVAVNTLLDKNTIDNKIKYKLNYLYDYNVDVVFTSHYSEAELDVILEGINITNKLLVLNGAALYDSKKKTYHNETAFTIEEKNEIDNILNDNNLFALRYVITEYFNKLDVFYNKDLPQHYKDIDDRLEYDYIKADILEDTLVTQYHFIDSLDNINKIKDLFNKYSCTIRKYDDEYFSLYINSNNTSKINQINYLNSNNKKIVSFVYKDSALNGICDELYCVENSNEEVKEISKNILKDGNDVVNKIKRIYFGR